jgi:hypothetical protein
MPALAWCILIHNAVVVIIIVIFQKRFIVKVFKKVKLICREVNEDDHNFHMMKNGIEKH